MENVSIPESIANEHFHIIGGKTSLETMRATIYGTLLEKGFNPEEISKFFQNNPEAVYDTAMRNNIEILG